MRENNKPIFELIELAYPTLDELVAVMQEHPQAAFIVTLRCKYKNESKWEYLSESCALCNFDDVIWLNDWHEGQEDVEYLYIAIVYDRHQLM